MAEIYLLRGQSEEVISHAFARTSRSPSSFRDLVKDLTDEKSAKFHEKWVLEYGHSCYDADTEVLTVDGWKLWAKVALSDRLATVNPDTRGIEYIQPIRLIREPYTGKMYEIINSRVNLLVTPNHKLWVCNGTTLSGRLMGKVGLGFSLQKAEDMVGKQYRMQIGGLKWDGTDVEFIRVGPQDIDARTMMRLVGFFIGDGHWDNRYRSSVEFHLKKQRKIDYLLNTIGACKDLTIMPRKNGKFGVKCPGLGDYLGMCYNERRAKVIPRVLLSLSKPLLECLFEGLMASDGHVGGTSPTYSTTSDDLKNQMDELCLKLGVSAHASMLNKERNVWSVVVNMTKLYPEVNKCDHQHFDRWVDYDGMVYCAEMPRNHVLVVRRDGRSCLSGNSIAEHTVLHIAIEGASRLAVEALESGRLASYTEQSTRYQTKTKEHIYRPESCSDGKFCYDFDYVIGKLFELYDLLDKTTKESQHLFSRPIKGFDLARFALPLATKVNLGMTINARSLRRLICKMLASPLREVRDLGNQLHAIGVQQAPTLLRHISPCVTTIGSREMKIESVLDPAIADEYDAVSVRCVKFDVDAAEIRQALAYPQSDHTFGAQTASFQDVYKHLDEIGEHDAFSRAFEFGRIVFEVVSDYGSYYDMKRHRMATLIPQEQVGLSGYVIPMKESLRAASVYEQYRITMNDAHLRFKKYPGLDACYMLPNAFRKRYLIQVNPRELFEIVKIRGINPHGHSSYRAIALRMLDECASRCPEVFAWMKKWCPPGIDYTTMSGEYSLVNQAP